MSRIIEFPKGNTREDEKVPLLEFIQENLTEENLKNVKGVACALFLEDGETDFLVSHLTWQEVLWVAVAMQRFATEDEDAD